MKKRLFLIASVFTAFSLQAQTSTLKVGADTGVKVGPSTLLYVNGDMKVSAYTTVSSNKRVQNEGNIKVTSKLINENADGSNFLNTYSVAGEYGQLIILGDVHPNSKVATTIKFGDKFVYHPIAVPYSDLTAKDLLGVYNNTGEQSFVGYNGAEGSMRYFDPNRKLNPVFAWDNGEHYLRHLTKDESLKPGVCYYVNKNAKGAGGFKLTKLELMGQPAPGNLSVNISGYKIGYNTDVNAVGEYFGSYILDYAVDMPSTWTNYKQRTSAGYFGAGIHDIANPYTSNIDLAKLLSGVKDKIQTVVQYTQGVFVDDQSNSYGTNIARPGSQVIGTVFSAFVPDERTGNNGMRYVRPMSTFSVKLKNAVNDRMEQVNLLFDNNVKTFESLPSTPNTLFNRKGKSAIVNQLGIELYNEKQEFTGVSTFVVASDIYEAAKQGKGTEVYNPKMADNHVGIYTLQENIDGSVNEELSGEKTYINGINGNKYIAKPIRLVFQNGYGKYTFRSNLNEDLVNSGNYFYFEDKKTGKITKVDKDFSYTFDIDGTDNDRFVLYWAATPSKVGDNVVAEETVDTTVVFKDGAVSKIRFDKKMGKADIFVYNISGQLINSAKNIDTNQDYVVPLSGNSAIYIVKIVGINGQVVTKKIIK